MDNKKWIEAIGAWGDSITYGACDKDALGWIGRLRRRIEHDHATEVYNFGVCGDTSVDLLQRFKVELKSINPGLVLIAIGTNDSRYRGGDKDNREVAIGEYSILKCLGNIARPCGPSLETRT